MSASDVSIGRLAVLASLPQITPKRLSMMFAAAAPERIWRVLRGEDCCGPVEAIAEGAGMSEVWRKLCNDVAAERMAQVCGEHGIGVTSIGAPEYPRALVADHQAPAVLFHRGALSILDALHICGVVGTRSASPAGRIFAERLGGDLAEAGVSVVSGLAKGIDAAAHSGVRRVFTLKSDSLIGLDARSPALGPPIAVVANGLDTVYPRQHIALFRDIAEHGVIISESPPGTSPEPYRFPLRNRMIAALSRVLIVVESRATGGSMHTVEAAVSRGVPVLAVPGGPGAPASVGTNKLIAEGCAPCVHADDVLVALGLHRAKVNVFASHIDDAARDVLALLSHGPMTLDALLGAMSRTEEQTHVDRGFDLVGLMRILGGLEARGLVACEAGWWQAVVAMT